MLMDPPHPSPHTGCTQNSPLGRRAITACSACSHPQRCCLVIGNASGEIHIFPRWANKHGNTPITCSDHTDVITSIVGAADHVFASASLDGKVCLWQIPPTHEASITPSRTLRVRRCLSGINAIAIHNKRLFAGGGCKNIRVWDWVEEQCLAELVGWQGAITFVVVNKYGSVVVGASEAGMYVSGKGLYTASMNERRHFATTSSR